MQTAKRFLSLLLALCIVLGMIPGTAFAANSDLPFTDVNASDWYYDAVQYAYANGIMSGTSTTKFSPEGTATRGMIVTVLHRMEGTPAAAGAAFTDVPAGQWYSNAVSWASANGIVGGYDDGLFGPNDPVTREQMAVILSRYSAHKGYDAVTAGSIADFSDASQVSSYAVEPMGWAVANGLITGVGNNTLAPKGNATRAQAAVVLMRFCKNIADEAGSTPGTPGGKTYTVTFDLNYGSDTRYDAKTVKKGETVSKPSNPSRSGYAFGGWYAEKSGGSQFDFKTGITSDLTLYAHWSSNSSSGGWTGWDNGGGSSGSGGSGSSKDCSITGLILNGSTATATVCTEEACKLHVQILTEDGKETLLTASANAAEGMQMENVSATMPGALPEHFIVRAVLTDDHNRELSRPYISRRYTSAYEEFEAQTPADFPDSIVLDFGENGFGVLKDDVQPLEGAATFSLEDNSYTVQTLANVQPGDKVLLNTEGAKTPVKVGTVTPNGDGSITITGASDAAISDLYQTLKLDIRENIRPMTRRKSPANFSRNDDPNIPKLSGNIITGPLTITASGIVTLDLRAAYDEVKFGKDYFECSAVMEGTITANATLTGAINSSDIKDSLGHPTIPEIILYEGPYQLIGPGVVALKLKITVPLEFGISASGKAEVKADIAIGYVYSSDMGMQKVKKCTPTQSFELEGKFWIKAGLKAQEDALFLGGLLEGSVSGQFGVEATGETAADITGDPEKKHVCKGCVDINASAFAGANVTLKGKVSEKLAVNFLKIDLMSNKLNLGKAYFSFLNDKDSLFKGKPTFGFGECPNYKYRITVVTRDPTDKIVTGIPVGIRYEDQVYSGTTPCQQYLYNGNYVAEADFPSGIFKSEFTVDNKAGTVTVKERQINLSGTVTDTVTKRPIIGATVTALRSSGEAYTATADSSKGYQLTIPPGSYTITFTAAGYKTENVTQTFTTDQRREQVNAELEPIEPYAKLVIESVTDPGGKSVSAIVNLKNDKNVVVATIVAPGSTQVVAGTYTVTAQPLEAGYEPASTTVTLSPGEEQTLSLQLEKTDGTGILSVEVIGENGKALSNATVTVKNTEGIVVGTAEWNLGYTVKGLTSGTYSVTVSAEGYASKTEMISITAGQTTGHAFKLEMESGVKWEFIEETATMRFYGKGPMDDYEYSHFYDYTDKVLHIVIEEGVTTVGNYACFSLQRAETLSLPSTITQIGNSAFANCYNLAAITSATGTMIPSSVTSIGNSAFRDCWKLSGKVVIPAGVTVIESQIFNGCDLTDVEIQGPVTSIDSIAFAGCEFTSFVIPDTVTELGASVFSDCKNLTSIDIPSGITEIKESTFYNCTSLKSVVFRGAVTKIDTAAFQQCASLPSITIPDTVTAFGSRVFKDCTQLATFTVPKNVSTISEQMFRNCSALKSVRIPVSVTYMSDFGERSSFLGCDALTDVYYEGTQSQWEQIPGRGGGLRDCIIHYSSY